MRNLFFLLMLLPSADGKAQQKTYYSLNEVIELAQSSSPGLRLAQVRKETAFFQHQVFRSDNKPQITLYGNLPVYNKEYFGVRQPDGTIKYQSISQNNSDIGIGIKQLLPFTGGELSLNTGLARFDDFKAKTKQYSGTPFFVRLSQPLFAVNELKWKNKIEPLRLEESQREYILEMENIAVQASSLYFDVLDAQNNMQIAGMNLENTVKNYEIEKKRVLLGTTTEDKLLQLELLVLNSRQNLEKAKYDYQIAQLNIRIFTGIKKEGELNFLVPGNIPSLTFNLEQAINYSKKYRPEFITFQRKIKEAQRDVALAKSAKQQVDLIASYGVNNIGNDIGSVYRNPNDQQRFAIGFNLPIVDWGRRNARYHTAMALLELTETSNEYEEATIYQEITTLVKNMELLRSNITLAQLVDSVATRRYNIANNLYQLGKITVTDLGLAQSEKDNSSRIYMNALRAYWNGYYLLRKQTFYDFEKNISLYIEGRPPGK
jgi:outer membrane protein TolC